MATRVRRPGFNGFDGGIGGGRMAFVRSNGNAVVIMRDTNVNLNNVFGDKDNVEKIHIYESSDRVTWTLRASIPTPATTFRLHGAMHEDDSLSIALMAYNAGTPKVIHYMKVGANWSVPAWSGAVDVGTGHGASARLNQMDMDVLGGSVVIAYTFSNSSSGNMWGLASRNSVGGWQAGSWQTNLHAGTKVRAGDAVSVCLTDRHQVSGTWMHQVVIALGYTVPNLGDRPMPVYKGLVAEGGFVSGDKSLVDLISVGDIPANATWEVARVIRMFRGSQGDVILAAAHSLGNKTMGLKRYKFENGAAPVTLTPWTSHPMTAAQMFDRGLGITYSNGVISFMAIVGGEQGRRHVVAQTAKLNTQSTWDLDSFMNFFIHEYDTGATLPYLISSGGNMNNDRDPQKGPSDLLYYTYYSAVSNNPAEYTEIMHEYARATGTAVQVTPAEGAQVADANPVFTARADTNRKASQSTTELEWQVATNPSMTTNVITFKSDNRTSVWGTDVDGVYSNVFSKKLPDIYALNGPTWYVRARLVDRYGNRSTWSAPVQMFTLYHPPVVVPIEPEGLTEYDDGDVMFQWLFSDSWAMDYQTAVEIAIWDRGSGQVVHQTGWVTQSDLHYVVESINPNLKGKELYWQARAEDSNGSAGPWSEAKLFSLMDEPEVAIVYPVDGGSVDSPVPRVQFNVSTSGDVLVKRISVEIRSENQVVWSRVYDPTTVTSPQLVTLTGNAGDDYFDNDQYYSVIVTVTDQHGLSATSDPISFQALWEPAATPTGVETNVDSYNTEDQGFVAVTWTDDGTEPEYIFYTVERKIDQIDVNTYEVVEEGPIEEVWRTYERLATYTFRDFTAPSGHKVSYRVRQHVVRFGDFVPSDPTAWVASYPQSDGYWLIDPTIGGDTANAFKLHNVTGDDFTEDYEESEYAVIGRGYHVDQGERLGYKGSLNAQLRHTNGSTARQKKLRLERIKANPRNLYIRNPFGDIFRVHIGNMNISRLAGTGLSEFSDVTIPYTEVSE